jgi:hypothetical protein
MRHSNISLSSPKTSEAVEDVGVSYRVSILRIVTWTAGRSGVKVFLFGVGIRHLAFCMIAFEAAVDRSIHTPTSVLVASAIKRVRQPDES